MIKPLPQRLLCLIMVVPILISMTALGIRLPTLAGLTSGKPKPRPRAIIQTQSKKIKETYQQQQQQPDCALPEITLSFTPPATEHPAQLDRSEVIPAPFVPLAARAPPALTIPASSL